MHPGHRADGISTSHCRNSVSDKCWFFFFFNDAKTSVGFMLAHYLNSEVFAHALK